MSNDWIHLTLSRLNHAGAGDHNFAFRRACRRTLGFDELDDVHAFNNLAKDDMLAVEPLCDGSGDEELGTISVATRVGHGQETRLAVAQLEFLVCRDSYISHAASHGATTHLQTSRHRSTSRLCHCGW
jgi:hypothetical protein